MNNLENLLDNIEKNKENYIFIHYSCEDLDMPAQSPRITGICVRNLRSRQDDSFNIVNTAEKLGINENDIVEKFEEIEQEMLNNFFEYVKENRSKVFIHWKMRSQAYGFFAIEHRAVILKCNTILKIEDHRKIDLSEILSTKYGDDYIGHPRMKNIIEKNNITNKDFLTGEQESQAFKNKNFRQIMNSTLRKVDCFESILLKVFEGKLKVDTNCLSIEKYKKIKDHPLFWGISVLASVVTIIAVFF